MFSLLNFAPVDLSRTLMWATVEISSRTAAPLVPIQTFQRVLDYVADYAGGHETSTAESVTTRLPPQQQRAFIQLINNAASLQEYQICAEQLDDLQEHNKWKSEWNSCEAEYNPHLIDKHMRELEYARSLSDVSAMQHLIRTSLSRDLGGMNIQSLYKHSWSGTKYLVEDYIASVLDVIEKFTDSVSDFNLATNEVKFYQQSLEDALKYFGRSALTLSGGATLGMKHIGVVKTLWEADVLPDIISGASAGSIVAAVVGVSNDEEMRTTLNKFPTSDLACFDPPNTGPVGWLLQRMIQFVRNGTFFSMENMERVMRGWLGDITFREAHHKTQRVLNICVSSADSGEPRILNFRTAPDVLIWSAVCASCSVPNVFPCASIYEKDPDTKETRVWMQHAKQMFVDGSLDHDIPMRKLSEMFNVNFFIVSQVNPHVRLFLDPEEEFQGNNIAPPKMSWVRPYAVVRSLKHALHGEILHRAQQARNLGIRTEYLRWASLFSQQYTGDINIFPEIHLQEYTTMLANPTPKFMSQATIDGERATWPKIYRIKNCVAIELALIRAIHTLKERVNFGPEARAAREVSRRSSRGRSYSIRGQRPGFLRRRSLSTGHETRQRVSLALSSGPPTPGLPTDLRRNRSLGALADRFPSSMTASSRGQTPLISPQAGLDNLFINGLYDSTLKMTIDSAVESTNGKLDRDWTDVTVS